MYAVDFDTRYKKLNDRQREAVDTIDGPLMVVAGPGTGKTELLSMRAANILRKTDTLPENILCLTFTESGAAAMRQRLSEIIGPAAYKIAIHTFHSFGSEVINQYGEYFYHGANFRPASDLNSYELLRSIFDSLEFSNPLASKMNDEYTHLADTLTVISELKKSGLTNEELLRVLESNESTLDAVESELAAIFSERVSKKTVAALAPIATKLAELPEDELPPGISPLSNVLALSLAHAIDAAEDSGKTTAVTAWKNAHLEKDEEGAFVFKDRRRTRKLREVSYLYYQYLMKMQEAELYDFDDMVLRVVHAMEVFPDLKYNLQERYLYVMVDEFQDTNLAQARILYDLTDTSTGDAPNIMVVGDDDQAIYSFQGAEVGNILGFRDRYESVRTITLTDNYRSADTILKHARSVITLGTNRLENHMPDLDKSLTAHRLVDDPKVRLLHYPQAEAERRGTARAIKKLIDAGARPDSIAVIARRHYELIDLLPHLSDNGVSVNYERRDNVLESDVIIQLVALSRIICHIARGEHDLADAAMPELLAHPAWGYDNESIWQLSLGAHKHRDGWLEQMRTTPEFKPLHDWLLDVSRDITTEPAEHIIDRLTGTPDEARDDGAFHSPLYEHYFGGDNAEQAPDEYVAYLEALRSIRSKLHEYRPDRALSLHDFIEFVDLHNQLGSTITSVRSRPEDRSGAINLMTAHKSKGLEYDHVFIIGAVDSAWGEQVRSRSRLIGYPENLPISPSGDTIDERLRLFFVAMTRARATLTISYSTIGDTGKALLPASFLVADTWKPEEVPADTSKSELVDELRKEWYHPFVNVSRQTMDQVLAPTLQDYKLSVTHLTTFLDVSRGGPQSFLIKNLLHFPSSKAVSAQYGSAIHATIQRAHSHLSATGRRKPVEDVLQDFEIALSAYRMTDADFQAYLQRGTNSLGAFLAQHYDSFAERQKVELNFAGQQSRIGDAVLTGSLDLVDIDDVSRTMTVTDYKTGAASDSWKGKSDGEKLKLHKYRQQLMFYKLLVERSRDYSSYTVDSGVLQFVEPTPGRRIVALELQFDTDELERFARLVQAVYGRIVSLQLPDITGFEPTFAGTKAFEDWLIDSEY